MEALVFLWDFPLIMEAIKEYENKYYRIMIVDKEERMPEYILSQQVIDETFNEVIVVDNIYDKEELSKVICNILITKKIKAIYGTFEEAIEMAGYLRDKFGIEGMGEEQAIRVRNKYHMKQTVRKGGIKTANIEIVSNFNEIEQFILKNSYPIIFKPIDGAATVDTYRISNESELLKLKNNVDIIRKLEGCRFVVEKYIKGEEYHCDSIVVNGKIEFVAIGKYLCNCIDTINTDRALGSIVFPNECNEAAILEKIKKVNHNVIDCLKINNAVCHMEVFVEDDGSVVFSEIATRIGGGPLIGRCIKNTHGIDIYKAFLSVELGEYNQKNEDKGLYTGFVAFSTKKGIITKISSEDDYKDMEGLVVTKIFNQVGDAIGVKNNTGDRTGYLILESKNYNDLKTSLENAYHKFILEVK